MPFTFMSSDQQQVGSGCSKRSACAGGGAHEALAALQLRHPSLPRREPCQREARVATELGVTLRQKVRQLGLLCNAAERLQAEASQEQEQERKAAVEPGAEQSTSRTELKQNEMLKMPKVQTAQQREEKGKGKRKGPRGLTQSALPRAALPRR